MAYLVRIRPVFRGRSCSSRSSSLRLAAAPASSFSSSSTSCNAAASASEATTATASMIEALVMKKKAYTATVRRDARPPVVILGSGWAGFQLARDLDKEKYDVTLISDRNHFLFTPLLPSTTVGTLEFRTIQEPVRTIPGITFYQAHATRLNLEDKVVACQEVFIDERFEINYEYLILAVGSTTNTFGIPGVCVENHVYFLKQLSDARAIRSRIIECFERASYPDLPSATQARLLSFVVVGGGPTSVEFASELYDFLRKDVHKWYPDLEEKVSVTLVEASEHILGTFDRRLVDYVGQVFQQRKVKVLVDTSVVKVDPCVVWLKDGTPLHFGLCVWSTGVKAVPLIESLPLTIPKGMGGRILVDDRLRLMGQEDKGIFAMGDCAVSASEPLPCLAQSAQQQARYLGGVLNRYQDPHCSPDVPPFKYKHMGSMAQLGMWNGVVDSAKLDEEGKAGGRKGVLKGLTAFLLWRAAYWTKSVSWANKMLIPMFWLKSWIFGRDISRF